MYYNYINFDVCYDKAFKGMTVNDVIKHYDKLLDMAKYHGLDDATSKDVVQDLFVKLIELQQKEGSLKRIFYNGNINFVYVFNAIRNMAVNIQKKSNRMICSDNIIGGHTDAFTLHEMEVEERLLAMDDKRYYHKLYHVYFKDDISMRELSKRSGISVTTIFYSVQHIREQLKDIFYEKRNDSQRKAKMVKDKNTI